MTETEFKKGDIVKIPFTIKDTVQTYIIGRIIKLESDGKIAKVEITKEPVPKNPHQDQIFPLYWLKCGEIIDFSLHWEKIDYKGITLID